MKSHFFYVLNFSIYLLLIAVQKNVLANENEPIWMFPNVGQCQKNVQFHIDINQGDFYVDNQGFTFSLFESPKKHDRHTKEKRNLSNNDLNQEILKGQTIRTKLINAKLTDYQLIGEKSKHFKTFFLNDLVSPLSYGNNKIRYHSIYKGIDLELSTENQTFKYSYYISPFSSINQIKQEISGGSGSYIDSFGNLHHKNIFGEIIEKKPKAWNILNNNSIREVKIEFELKNNQITYKFPEGYNNKLPLVIDPELIFSSFTGSTSDNWGFTATNDNEGNLYSAGICFGIGYPTTTGVFDINYRDGEVYQVTNNGIIVNTIPGFDITISKFSKDGKSIIYSSYLGGKGNETPNSIIVNKKNELVIFGATSSPDFPVTSNAFDKTYNGGTEFKTMDFFFSGSDIFITKISQNADKIIASTFLGGTNNDGISKGQLIYNYGDNFRGEINLNSSEEILIISTTNSSDFPTKNAFQNNLSGKNDAITAKLSPNLDQLLFSSYLGGPGEETGNSIQFSNLNNKIYISGGTTSIDFNSIKSKLKNSYLGGAGDGYLAIINDQSNAVESFRFVGTSSYDQVYFVQLDSQLNTYVLGQTEGKIGISPGKYGNPNSGQFISKFNPDLTQFLWSTTIGGQSGFVEISPTAFLVSECNDIFLSGWGSSVNQYEEHAMNSSTLNFPVTDDAIQKNTEGDNFYIAVLNNDGENLKYGSFFGGLGQLGSHVDGGTSRFDKKGGIYHAVCGGCGGNPNGFSTTPGVWSEQNKSPNCNLAAFKIELNKIKAIASAEDSIICSGNTIKFTNNSRSADTYEWDFGDNTKSFEKNPVHLFKNEGKYKVRLIASDSKNCVLADTLFIDIKVNASLQNKNLPVTFLCKDTILTLEMDKPENASYTWKVNNNNIEEKSNQLKIKIKAPMSILGTLKENCTSTVYEFRYEKLINQLDFNHDYSICLGEEVKINIGKVSSVDWLDQPQWKNKNEFSFKPVKNTTLPFIAKTIDGCPLEDSLHIEVLTPSSKLINFLDTNICIGDSIKINTKYITNFKITPDYFLSSKESFFYLKPRNETTYSISYTDPCGIKNETFKIKIRRPELIVSNDTTICLGDSILIKGSNMNFYSWQNYEYAKIQPSSNELKVSPKFPTSYNLLGMDELGCKDYKKINVTIFPKTTYTPTVIEKASWENPATVVVTGKNIKSIKWFPSSYLSCDSCFIVNASIYKDQLYTISIKDEYNCTDSTFIFLDFESTLYIPNTFYPESKNGNELFKAVGLNIRDFEMTIYNRWGELLKTITNINEGWDGIYKNQLCPNDVYVWKVKYLTDREEFKELTGHVTLLR